jgi:hypothetical protein
MEEKNRRWGDLKSAAAHLHLPNGPLPTSLHSEKSKIISFRLPGIIPAAKEFLLGIENLRGSGAVLVLSKTIACEVYFNKEFLLSLRSSGVPTAYSPGYPNNPL